VARRELSCLLAGPSANLLICVGCALALLAMVPHTQLVVLFNPVQPAWTLPGASLVERSLKLTLWINWLLFLFNLLPAFPFDGGRVLRCLISWVRPQWTDERCAATVFWVALTLTGVITVTAIVLWKNASDSLFPVSPALLLLAVVLLVSARRELQEVGEAREKSEVGVCDPEPEDPWRGAGHYERRADEPGVAGAWEPEPEVEPPHDQQTEAEEERQVDLILTRLHTHGMEHLTLEERQLLERVSARYRHRLGRRT
jgi:hypothetical protein